MSTKKFLAGLGVGLVAGYFIRESLNQANISPERALKNVKKQAGAHHQISGSWIHMVPETLHRNEMTYEVYIGGLSTQTESGIVQYDFVVDTKTGTIIEMSKNE
ncbi:hypothetical protein AJ85_03165 [Alkalihalobacillus alcalophilus ATCC 27647 = CGMCC 1.3604]|uniref:PepSY domain-containing protein n=1 Tax=Alkalihalobacillus alcalophilus ATCC 27647 = CGMCC 1.3604 TaxID=1218173 RepID=A0A094WM07_ALKAL|nr:PepSY domain-containing protein [Alkalihalobacillus alcalophilus]KGA98754.1 hypothetical protein BALCAV_0202270 [Alkalihalobacillus alcalophilus ATCC 27647 = CGMCC 1.3604]MED1562296.1 PepSY domain-containing protein [Alkalihalobacillus alcalophilus]THG88480.1 hypothetical protein AJ85_03165 [Alkalihalobacillus alcalophilus ATCC 27647 = CGMCC 1.3604]